MAAQSSGGEDNIIAFSTFPPQNNVSASVGEIFSFDDARTQVPAHGALATNGNHLLNAAGDSGASLGFTFQEESIVDELRLFTTHMDILTQDHGEPEDEAVPILEIGEDIGVFTAVSDIDPAVSDRGSAVKMLLSLASELNARLETLESISRQWGDTSQTLDGYPIGSVLHLSREFTRIAAALKNTKNLDEECRAAWTPGSASAGGSSSASAATSSSYCDTSVSLILLSCYLTLTQVCTVVLGHFQTHLSSQSGSRVAGPPANIRLAPQVRLGELPPTNVPHSRLHTAVSMLLDSLAQAEEAIGPVPGVRVAEAFNAATYKNGVQIGTTHGSQEGRDQVVSLIRWEVLTSTASIRDEFTEIEQKITNIKELLKERMGF